jgi:hypothetical protein
VRRKEGLLLTSLANGDASSRLVEAYRLHPNAIKALARCGQDTCCPIRASRRSRTCSGRRPAHPSWGPGLRVLGSALHPGVLLSRFPEPVGNDQRAQEPVE